VCCGARGGPLFILLVLATTGTCSGPERGGGDGAPLSQAATLFNQHLRWGSPMAGLEYVAPEGRDAFLRSVQSSMSMGQVMDVEIQGVRTGPGGDSAEVFVVFVWTPGDSITTRSGVLRQTWKRQGKRWQIHAAEAVGEEQALFAW